MRTAELCLILVLLLVPWKVAGSSNRSNKPCPKGCVHGTCFAGKRCNCELGYSGPNCNVSIWEQVEHTCYPRSEDQNGTWQAKASECQKQGGRLALVRPPLPTGSASSASDCPVGFVRLLEHSCHLFSGEEVTWEQARQRCHGRGAHLVTIQDARENQAVKSYISKTNLMNHFIGAHVQDRKSRWVWEENGNSAEYTDWKPGEPNNLLQKEYCAAISASPGDQFQWMDTNCEERNAYVCESERLRWISPGADETHLRCPPKFLNLGALGCYYLSYDDKATAQSAANKCQELGGYLAVVESVQETRALRREVRRTVDNPVYVGSSGGLQTCAMMSPFRESVYLNKEEACSKQLPYLCETDQRVWFSTDVADKADVLVRCPPGYIKLGSEGCFRFSGKEKMTWNDAKKRCENLHGYLASIESYEDLGALQNYIRRIGMQDYYIGLSDIKKEGEWTWEPFGQPALITDWYIDEPNNYGDKGENCALMSAFASCDLQWEDVNCDGKYAFICETDQREWISKSNPSVRRECPLKFTEIRDFGCYYLSEEKAAFREAADKCREMNSYLVRVESAMENGALKGSFHNTFFEDIFIGASSSSRDQWLWHGTEENLHFFNWRKRQPDDSDGQNSCLAFSAGDDQFQWATVNCQQRINFVCETDKREVPES